jgi:hypothetical protein
MSRKVLLLTQSYEFNSFIEINRAIKLLYLNKVEVISYWEDWVSYASGKLKIPAILKLNYPIKRFSYSSSTTFNRSTIIKRDRSTCQYCGKTLSHKEITLDHVIPRSQGGKNNFTNCVVCCFPCNKLKGSRTPEQADMKLFTKPVRPTPAMMSRIDKDWHEDWNSYLN